MVGVIDQKLFEEAKRYLIGGVNSPVRSFKAVGGIPVFVNSAKGSKIYDENSKGYIDYCLSWGAAILGHCYPEVTTRVKEALDKGLSFGAATKLETELAHLITDAMPSIEKLRLTNSGTEAVMAAIRLARAHTKRDGIVKFSASYHGHADYLLNCPGIPGDFLKHTITVSYNDSEKLAGTIKRNKDTIAAIIVEPVEANTGVVLPEKGFLKTLREIADRHNIVLIFDEVITGFRLGYGGAQEYFDVRPDLTCLGKIVGGGLPIGAFGGRKDIMALLAPEGDVYQAGTFSGNPVSVTGGIATLKVLKKTNPYRLLEERTSALCEKMKLSAVKKKIKIKINHIASMFSISFEARDKFNKFYHRLLSEGIYLSPSSHETNFISVAHTEDDISKTLEAVYKTLEYLGSS